MGIPDIVEKLRREHGTGDPFEICRRMGVTVVESELPGNVSGFFSKQDGLDIICINDCLSERMKAVVCAHELGHCLLHGCSNAFFMKNSTHFVLGRMEREADLFCACLLIPDTDFEEYAGDSLTVETISNITGLPERIVKLRFGLE